MTKRSALLWAYPRVVAVLCTGVIAAAAATMFAREEVGRIALAVTMCLGVVTMSLVAVGSQVLSVRHMRVLDRILADTQNTRSATQVVVKTSRDIAGTVGRQAPVVRRIDDRSRAILERQVIEGQQVRTPWASVRVLRGLGDWESMSEVARPLLVIIPKDVPRPVAEGIVSELGARDVHVIPEEFLAEIDDCF